MGKIPVQYVDGSKLLRRRVRLCRFGLSAIVLKIGLLPVLLAGLGHVQDAGGGGKAGEEAGKAPWNFEMLAYNRLCNRSSSARSEGLVLELGFGSWLSTTSTTKRVFKKSKTTSLNSW